jgi:predicted DNA-binding transcriptional regulator AlpA
MPDGRWKISTHTDNEFTLSAPMVERLTGLTRKKRERLQQMGEFPKPRKISRYVNNYHPDDINDWLRARELGNR